MKTLTIISVCESPRTHVKYYKNYEELSVRLAKSMRKNGGSIKNTDMIFWYGEDRKPSQETIDKLVGFGCHLVSGKCEVPEDPVSNQFTASNLKVNTDYVMWIDADMYINGPLDGILDFDTDIAMAPDTMSVHTWSSSSWDSNWDIFYKYFNVIRPPKIISHVDKKPINFYFNNAVTVFKNGIGYPEMWRDTALKLISSGLPNCNNQWYMPASSLAVLRGKYSITHLPEHFHYIYGLHDHKVIGSPAIIHCQDARITEISDEDWKI